MILKMNFINIMQYDDLTIYFKRGSIQATGGYFMNIFDIDYSRKEKDLFKYHYTCLLSELLILNYEFSNHKYNGITGNDVFNKLQKRIKLSEKEKQSIISNAILLIEIKYNKKLSDFEKIEFS